MLVVETVIRIGRERAAGKPIKAVARDLNLLRKVVRKAIRSPEGAFTYRFLAAEDNANAPPSGSETRLPSR